MIKVFPLNEKYFPQFKKAFADYYAELDCEDDGGHLAEEYILPDVLSGEIYVDILESEKKFAGFVVYQTDGGGKWDFKSGFGDIREIYISPSLRMRGLGKFLLFTAEMKLKERGAEKAYCLPSEGAEAFFLACGYEETEERNAELDCPVFVKNSLVNRCK